MSQSNNVSPIRKAQSFLNCTLIFFRLSFFSASPEHLSYSLNCLIKSIIIYASINMFLLDARSSPTNVVLQVALELGLLALFLKIGFKLTKKPERFLQTFSALVGVSMVISLVSLPIYFIFIPEFLNGDEVNQSVINITVMLLVWNLAIISHIFKKCFEVSTLMSAVISFNYLIVFEIIMISLSTGAS